MIVACRLPNGLDIGGFVLKGNYVGVSQTADAANGGHNALAANAAGRERIAGYEITRDVPNDVWERWYASNANGPIVQLGNVYGSEDEQELAAWCWRNAQPHGHAHGAPRDGSSGTSIPQGRR